MWVLLTSCLRVGPENRPVTSFQADESCCVTVQQAGAVAAKSLVIAGTGGCIDGEYAYISLRQKSDDILVALNLNKLPVRTEQTDKICTFPDLQMILSWSTVLPAGSEVNGNIPAPGTAVGFFKGHTIGVITARAMAYACDPSNGELKISSQIADTKILSSNMSVPGDYSMLCLLESGTIYRVSLK